ncbi:hypothetical protein CDES_09125 [Corynebacterium deserti GIMN1.010]|uniref:UPF0102 protein CDES_09125 n=1 Tax=Corynebacterium deserti GIMN1.010 TaxID=931089 RepID=A0A0M4CQK4_9CORY|nr:YraN family protein [Corynebacterium deserti]ALC06217.1 hypothetical protein CDES_09125 [Corynebacterium deserti GIMN1.010]
MKMRRQRIGAMGEDIALQHYVMEGALLLDRNVSYPCGEIDLIIEDCSGATVFVEVKTRVGEEFGGAESVGRGKMTRMRKAAMEWVEGRPYCPLRFDVVVVILDRELETADITVYEGVEHGAR